MNDRQVTEDENERFTETYPTPEHGWVCFHCGEHFPGNLGGQKAARLHFGASIYDEPKCQISAHRLRYMEAELRRYREEDTDLHREIARLKCEHATTAIERATVARASNLMDEHGRPYHPDMELSWQTYLGNNGQQQPAEVRRAFIAAWYAGRTTAPETFDDSEKLDPNRQWESDLEDRMGAKLVTVENETVQLAESLRTPP